MTASRINRKEIEAAKDFVNTHVYVPKQALNGGPGSYTNVQLDQLFLTMIMVYVPKDRLCFGPRANYRATTQFQRLGVTNRVARLH